MSQRFSLRIHPSLWLLVWGGSVNAVKRFPGIFLILCFEILVCFSVPGLLKGQSPDYTSWTTYSGYFLFYGFMYGLSRQIDGLSTSDYPIGAEQFVFSAPFKSIDLIKYSLIKTIPISILNSALFAGFVGSVIGSSTELFFRFICFLAAWLAMDLGFVVFFQRLNTKTTAVLSSIASKLLKFFSFIFVAATALSVFGFDRQVQLVAQSKILRGMLFPFFKILSLLFAPGSKSTLEWIGGCTLFSVVCFAISFYLIDADSEFFMRSRYKALEKLEERKKKLLRIPKQEAKSKFSLPDFPHMNGAGPFLWLSCIRGLRGLQFYARIALLLSVLFLLAVPNPIRHLRATLPGSRSFLDLLCIPFLWIAVDIFGFALRRDSFRQDQLRVFPVSPVRLVVAQLAFPSLFLGFVYISILCAFGVTRSQLNFGRDLAGYFFWIVPLSVLTNACLAAAKFSLSIFRVVVGKGTLPRSFIIQMVGAAYGIPYLISLLLRGVVNLSSSFAKHWGGSQFVFFSASTLILTLLALLTVKLAAHYFYHESK